ncbi:MAG: hypothetical protein ABIZ07_11275 [Dermatophilaceae bacterium]
MNGVAGDAASTSVLGGALRRHALDVVDVLDGLESPGRSGSRAGGPDQLAEERELLASAAAQLDRIGARLQAWSTDAVERTSRRRGLDEVAARDGLLLDGRRVVEVPGPSRVEPTTRLQSRDRLQDLLNRLTSSDAKSLAGLARELESSTAALARLAERARARPR